MLVAPVRPLEVQKRPVGRFYLHLHDRQTQCPISNGKKYSEDEEVVMREVEKEIWRERELEEEKEYPFSS
jgi:hypothetical protein